MAFLQGLKEGQFSTFDDIGFLVLQYLKTLFYGKNCIGAIAIVFDRYDNCLSIKHMERQRRGSNAFRKTYVINGSITVPNYRYFIKNSANKASLATFLTDYIIHNAADILRRNQVIVLAGGFPDGQVVKSVSKDGVSELTAMHSSHEEADTRMILHAVYLSAQFERIVVRSDDTDVLVLLLHYANKNMLGGAVYMHDGHTTTYANRKCYIPVSKIATEISHDICQSLPAAHCLTGCDRTSSFFKIGKCTAYAKLVEYLQNAPTSLSEFGLSMNTENDITSAQAYILTLHQDKLIMQRSEQTEVT